MTTSEIRQHIDQKIDAHFESLDSESGEMMTGEGGDGRFFGKVVATRYAGLPKKGDFFLAIGQTDQSLQIVRLGRSECLTPTVADLDVLLFKELGIEIPN